MEKEGYVSLWIGNIKSDDELMAYVELEYTDDGDCIPSKFLKDFSIDIDDFDEDFIERVCHENKVSSISELISGCSYEEIILPKIEEKMEGQFQDKVNSAILLYNFDFDEKIDRVNTSQYTFTFICSVKYKQNTLQLRVNWLYIVKLCNQLFL